MIVGICGAAGAGKDTVGDALVEKLRYDRDSFARPLKDILCYIFGWDIARWEDREWKEAPNNASYGFSPRYVAQTFGTEWGRKMISQDLWVEQTLASRINDSTVYTDVRFPNEARAIRDAGGLVIFVECRNRPTTTEHTAHESEAWLPWLKLFADASIAADLGQIDQLREAAVQVVTNYRRGNVPRFVGVSQETRDQLQRLEEEINERFE